MTTFILAGGCDSDYPEYMTQLSCVVHSLVARPKILSCEFAVEAPEIESKFLKHKAYFEEFFGDCEEYVMARRDIFLEQVQGANVVYFHGGRTSSLMAAMQAYPEIEKIFAGKVIIGTSAGANYLSRYGFSPSVNEAVKGGGLVDVAVVPHYGSRGFEGRTFDKDYWQSAVEAVRSASGKDEVVLLPEGAFVVIER